MDSEAVNQWLDADQVRALAESLLVSAPPADPIPNESFYGDSFEGFADAVPVQQGSGAKIERSDTAKASSPPGMTPNVRKPDNAVQPNDQKVDQRAVEKPRPDRTAGPAVSPRPTESPRPEVNEAKPVPERPRDPRPAVQRDVTHPKPVEVTPTARPKVVPVETQPAPPPRVATGQSPFKIAKDQPNTQNQPDDSRSEMAAQPGAPRKLPFSSRLEAFGVWLKEQIPTRAYFICDRNGEIVVDEVGSEKLVKVARTLAHASSNAGRQVGDNQALGSLHVKIGPDRVMEVVPRHSQYGLVILGLIVPRPLSREAVGSVSRGLGTVLADQSSPSQ